MNERDGVSNYRRFHCLLNCWFMRRSKKTSKLRVTGLCTGNSPVAGEFPAQKASNGKMWLRIIFYQNRARAFCRYFSTNMPQFHFYFQLIWYLFANENLIIILVVNENDRYFSSNTIATIIKLYPMPIYWNYPGTIPHTRDIIDIARGGMSEGQILRLYSDKRTTNTAEMSLRTMLWNNHCNHSGHDTTPHISYQAMEQLTNTEMSDTHSHSTELPYSAFTWIWHFRELITPQRIERVCFR